MADEIAQNTRLLSLDVFRGITVAGMVLVNNPGSWSAIYAPLEHAEWHGATPTDFIFPFFLFIVGVSISLALGKRVERQGVNRELYLKIFKRAAMIYLCGLFLATFPFYNFTKGAWLDVSTVRIMGVLPRIAVCYLFAALIYINTNWKQQAIIAAALLLIYWALMTLINVPGCEITTIDDKACNLSAYIDRLVLTENHSWRQSKVFDPGRFALVNSGDCDDIIRRFVRGMAEKKARKLRNRFGAVFLRRRFDGVRLVLEFLVSVKQIFVDKFVCSLYNGFGAMLFGILLLAD